MKAFFLGFTRVFCGLLIATVFLNNCWAFETCDALFLRVKQDSAAIGDQRYIEVASDIAHESMRIAETKLQSTGLLAKRTRGYAILVGTMVGSAALTSYLISHLPPNYMFLSYFVAQVSTLGVYVFGGAIWDPLLAASRKVGYRVNSKSSESWTDCSRCDEIDSLNKMYARTQENYSLNEQMSRNIINQFLVSIKSNFYEAKRSMELNEVDYAVDQIAEAAVRLRVLFRDVEPDDASVALAVKTSFSRHVRPDISLSTLVLNRIRELDDGVGLPAIDKYYSILVSTWMEP